MLRFTPLALVAWVLAAGCGSDRGGDASPGGCPESSDRVVAALRAAPRTVTVGGVPLSRCLTRRSEANQVQRIGTLYVEAAARLSSEVRRDPRGAAAVRLGYLVGAARRGSGSTQGIHTELVRRLEQELVGLPRSPELRRGIAAGRRSG